MSKLYIVNMMIQNARLTLRGLSKSKAQRFRDEIERLRGTTNLTQEWLFNRIKRLLLPGNYIACETCGMATTFDGITIDHKVPRSSHLHYAGNIHAVENLELICSTCNSLKGQKTLPDFLEFLKERNEHILQLRKSASRSKDIVAPLLPHIGLGEQVFGRDTSIERLRYSKKHGKRGHRKSKGKISKHRRNGKSVSVRSAEPHNE